MRAMVFERPGEALLLKDAPVPRPGPGQVLLEVAACGICRTDLHIFDGDLTDPKLPLIPGHEIVGRVVEVGAEVSRYGIGDRVGIPWLGYTCGTCRYCKSGRENLCENARFTGYTIDGGYAEYAVADARYAFPIPEGYSDAAAAPLLCAGLIGYRAYRMTGDAERIGMYGFGAAAHVIAQVAVHQGKKVYAFTRPGDREKQAFALGLGAVWAGDSTALPPERLDAAIIFAPVGELVPAALRAIDKGGIVVCAGIHMSDIPAFPYDILWEERRIASVANLTRHDGEEFMTIAREFRIETSVAEFPLEEANAAIGELRAGRITGAAVLIPHPPFLPGRGDAGHRENG